MITFEPIKQGTLDVASGTFSGATPKQKPASIGMDTGEFHNQVMMMAEKKIPLENAFSAIDKHPDITDRPKAKQMAEAVYQIIGSSPSK